MRWNSRIRFALLPKECDYCYNIFWLERYTIDKRMKMNSGQSYISIECQECKKIKRKKSNETQG